MTTTTTPQLTSAPAQTFKNKPTTRISWFANPTTKATQKQKPGT